MKFSKNVLKFIVVAGIIDVIAAFGTTVAGLITIFTGSGVALKITVTLSVIMSASKIVQLHYGGTRDDDDIEITY